MSNQYQNTSYEVLRKALVASDLAPTKISWLSSDIDNGITEYGVAIPSVHLIELMDRTDDLIRNLRKINRVLVPKLFAYYDHTRKSWIVRLTIKLMMAWEIN